MPARLTLIREYINAFNERRLQDAAMLFTEDAPVQHRPRAQMLKGPEGYLESARQAMSSFPDLHLEIAHIEQRGDTIFEIDLVCTGTHVGDWVAEGLGTLKPTGTRKTLRVRETLEIRGGRITFSSLTYNMPDFIDPQLST